MNNERSFDFMSKYYIIIAHNGVEVIDNTPHADSRLIALDLLEEEYFNRIRRKKQKKKSIFHKIVCFCGLV